MARTTSTVELASKILETLPRLCPQKATVLAAIAPGEMGSLLAMLNRPECSRLAKYLTQAGRPKNSTKEEAARHRESEELSVGESASDYVLSHSGK